MYRIAGQRRWPGLIAGKAGVGCVCTAGDRQASILVGLLRVFVLVFLLFRKCAPHVVHSAAHTPHACTCAHNQASALEDRVFNAHSIAGQKKQNCSDAKNTLRRQRLCPAGRPRFKWKFALPPPPPISKPSRSDSAMVKTPTARANAG